MALREQQKTSNSKNEWFFEVIRCKNRFLKIESDLTNRPLALINTAKTYSQTLQINKYLTTFLCRKIISNDTKKTYQNIQ